MFFVMFLYHKVRAEIEKSKEESRLQIALEKERARMEADERAMDGMKSEIEKTKANMAEKMRSELAIELNSLKQAYEEQLKEAERERVNAIKEEEKRLRDAFELTLAEEKAKLASDLEKKDVDSKSLLAKNLEAEQLARKKFAYSLIFSVKIG